MSVRQELIDHMKWEARQPISYFTDEDLEIEVITNFDLEPLGFKIILDQ